jgi:glycerophosphoryl diester phosphodiesterase
MATGCSTTTPSGSPQHPTVIAHRGASGYLPEHTLDALSFAHALGADYIEPDIVMTKDGHLIVQHDIHLDSTTDVATVFPKKKRSDGRYYAADFNLSEIKRLKVFERFNYKTKQVVFSDRFPGNTGNFSIATLDEYITVLKGLNISRKRQVGIYIEPKAYSFHEKEGLDIIGVLMQTLHKYKLDLPGSKTVIQSFDPDALKMLKNDYSPAIPLVQLIADNSWGETEADYNEMQTEAGIKAISRYADGIGPWIPQVLNFSGKELVPTGLASRAQAQGLFVHPYTFRVDDLSPFKGSPEELLDALFRKAKVDGVFADQPDRALKFLSPNQ